ncbi:MAG: hypothetical protein R2715_02775 [Ilumatobacteraceae bacterium]
MHPARGRRHLRRLLESLVTVRARSSRPDDGRVPPGLGDAGLVVVFSALSSAGSVQRAARLAERDFLLVVDTLPADLGRRGRDPSDLAWRIEKLRRGASCASSGAPASPSSPGPVQEASISCCAISIAAPAAASGGDDERRPVARRAASFRPDSSAALGARLLVPVLTLAALATIGAAGSAPNSRVVALALVIAGITMVIPDSHGGLVLVLFLTLIWWASVDASLTGWAIVFGGALAGLHTTLAAAGAASGRTMESRHGESVDPAGVVAVSTGAVAWCVVVVQDRLRWSGSLIPAVALMRAERRCAVGDGRRSGEPALLR